MSEEFVAPCGEGCISFTQNPLYIELLCLRHNLRKKLGRKPTQLLSWREIHALYTVTEPYIGPKKK